MFILLSKSFLILDKDDISLPSTNKDNKKYFVVFDLKRDSTQFTEVEWLPSLETHSKQSGLINKNVSFTCGTFSSSQDFLSLSDDQKNIVIFNQYFSKIQQFKVKKNVIKMRFSKNEDIIFICDKSGDIYEFNIKPESSENSGRLLLGHCSMLLDFIITDDQNYLISSDRDEKIRITHYPNTYNIATYCLGHTEFVSAIKLINDKILVSGSGDGKIKIWDYLNGRILLTYDCESHQQHTNTYEQITEMDYKKKSRDFAIKSMTIDQMKNGHHLCVSFYTKPIICLFKIIYTDEMQFSSLKFINQLCLIQVPVLISFDLSHINFLWIFEGGGDTITNEPIKLYELKQNELAKPLVKMNVIEILNQNEHFKESIAKKKDGNLVKSLFKHSYSDNNNNPDNSYYQSKKSRIESECETK